MPTSTSALVETLQEAYTRVSQLAYRIPGSPIVWRYVQASHRNDPLRTLLELALVFFVIRLYSQNRTKSEASGKNFVELTDAEVDELVREWEPEPLVRPTSDAVYPASPRVVIVGPAAAHVRVRTSAGETRAMNLVTCNVAGFANNALIKEKATTCLRHYGAGACGPFGFYGYFDVHIELERAIADFLRVPSAIVYAHDFSTVTSVIPTFAKRGDIVVVDRAASFAIQKGVQISRARVHYYEHGNYAELESILERIAHDDRKYGRNPTSSRRFIIAEGLCENDGSIVDLPRIMALKKKFKYRLVLDETWSFGLLGRSGRGVTEYFDVPASSVDIITGALSNGTGASGGFCAGHEHVTHHQRINSPASIFSAAMPPLLAVSSAAAIALLASPAAASHPLAGLDAKIAAFRAGLVGAKAVVPSAADSPMVHLQLPGEQSVVDALAALDEISAICLENGVLVRPVQRNHEQETIQHTPSLRVFISNELSKKEVEKAAQVIKNAFGKVVGRRR